MSAVAENATMEALRASWKPDEFLDSTPSRALSSDGCSGYASHGVPVGGVMSGRLLGRLTEKHHAEELRWLCKEHLEPTPA
jgi:hypothetical protein